MQKSTPKTQQVHKVYTAVNKFQKLNDPETNRESIRNLHLAIASSEWFSSLREPYRLELMAYIHDTNELIKKLDTLRPKEKLLM